MAPQCSSNNTHLEPKKGKIANWEMENESSTTFESVDDVVVNTPLNVVMGSSFASLGDSSWANAELEDLFEVASSPKESASSTNKEEKTTTSISTNDEKVVVRAPADMMTPPPRQRSTLSISQFEREGMLKRNKSDRSLVKGYSSNHNPLVSPRERKGLKKSKSERRFTGLETKKISRPGSLRDLKKQVGEKPSSRQSSHRDLGAEKDVKDIIKPLKNRKAKDNFESSDWLTSCYVDPFENKAGDNEPKTRTRTIVVDNDDEGNSHDGKTILASRALSSPKPTTSASTRPTLLRTTSTQSVQRAKADQPASSKNSNYAWNKDQEPTISSTETTSSRSREVPTLKRSTSNTEGSDGKDRRGRFGLTKAFHSFRQLPTEATTPIKSSKQTNLRAVLRGAVQVIERRPSAI